MINTSKRNKTICLTENDKEILEPQILTLDSQVSIEDITNKIINQDLYEAIKFLPNAFVDLLFLDPPYNLDKKFNDFEFKKQSMLDYAEYFESIIKLLLPLLTPNASIYMCGDWLSSTSLHLVLEKYFIVQNRITWEREKGRGAKRNWKNNTEDIWFCTMNNKFVFNADDVKLKRKVIAPYRDEENRPKDWKDEENGQFRLTYPSNIWTDISIPFWSMPENTEHPTQKPEKLLAKIILASSNENDFVFDPFAGSGTTCVVAKKTNRRYLGLEIDKLYSLIALKRLMIADEQQDIQGYQQGVFWERNSYNYLCKIKKK